MVLPPGVRHARLILLPITFLYGVCVYSLESHFYVKNSRLEIQNNSFSRLGVKLWNKIPRYTTDRIFQRKLSKDSPQIAIWYPWKGRWLYSNPMHDYSKSRYIDTLAKGFNVCFSFSVLSLYVSKRRVKTSVLFILSCNLQGFLIVSGFCFY